MVQKKFHITKEEKEFYFPKNIINNKINHDDNVDLLSVKNYYVFTYQKV